MIHQPQRLRIVALLHRNRRLSFVALRDALDLTHGNLGSHLAKLTEAGYVAQRRVLAGLRFELVAEITPRGSEAFRAYVAALRTVLETGLAPEASTSADP